MTIFGNMAGSAPRLAIIASRSAKSVKSVSNAIFDSPPVHRDQYAPDVPLYPSGPSGPASFVPNPAYNPTAPLPAAHRPMMPSVWTEASSGYARVGNQNSDPAGRLQMKIKPGRAARFDSMPRAGTTTHDRPGGPESREHDV